MKKCLMGLALAALVAGCTTPCVLFTTFACIVKWLDGPFARRTSVTHTAVPRLGATVTRRSIGGV